MPMAKEAQSYGGRRAMKSAYKPTDVSGGYSIPRPINPDSFWASELQNFMKI